MTPEQYRQKYESGELTEREELIYLKEENQLLKTQISKHKLASNSLSQIVHLIIVGKITTEEVRMAYKNAIRILKENN